MNFNKRLKKKISQKYFFSYLILLIITLFFLNLIFPNVLIFTNHIEYKNFHIYSDSFIHVEICNVINRVDDLLKTSEIYDSDVKFKIFICDSYKVFSFFAPVKQDAFGVTYPFINNVIITKTNIKNNLVVRNAEMNNTRELDSILAHEATHHLIEEYLGFVKNGKLEEWKKEGYCEYVANRKLSDLFSGSELILDNNYIPNENIGMFQNRILVAYLLEIKGLSFDEFINTKFNMEKILQEFKIYLKEENVTI